MGNYKSKVVETPVVKTDNTVKTAKTTELELELDKKVTVDELTKALDTLSKYYLETDLLNIDKKITKSFVNQFEGVSESYQNVYGSQIQIDNFLTGSNSSLYPTLDFTEKSGLFEQKEKELIENIHKLGNYYKKLADTVILELGESENLEDKATDNPMKSESKKENIIIQEPIFYPHLDPIDRAGKMFFGGIILFFVSPYIVGFLIECTRKV